MVKNKFVAIASAVIMTVTMSMPPFAFAQESSTQAVDNGLINVESELQGDEEPVFSDEDTYVPAAEEDSLDIDKATPDTFTENPASDFEYSIANGEVTIIDYIGSKYKVIIPENIEGLPVTKIANYAFEDYSHLTNITIPDSVTSIGDQAFKNCSDLTSITLPNSVTSIGSEAFRNCSGLENINLFKGINIEDGLFWGCSSLNSVEIPEGVTNIGASAFNGCSKLSSITLPNSLTSIGQLAFARCNGLSNITIPDSVTNIGAGAFSGCSKLSGITIPSSVETLGDYAFRNCTSLDSITIPDNVTSIGTRVFEGCSNLDSITVSETNQYYSIFEGCLFNKNKTILIEDLKLKNRTSYTVPNSVEKIGDNAFSDCESLNSIVIPDSVMSIGAGAFSECSKLNGITIPSSVKTLGDYAFRNCTSLDSITIPDAVTNIGATAFGGCSSLSSIVIPNGVTSLGDGAFSGCSSLRNITLSKEITSIGDYSFYGCSSLSNIIIPEGITSIGHYSFYDCNTLNKIKLPTTITSINSLAIEKRSRISLIVYENSYAHTFAIKNGYNYEIDESEIKATNISLNRNALNLEIGKTFKLTAEILPEDTLQKQITWTTNNNDVIKIDSNGTVEALQTGNATVTATTVHGLTATCKVTVNDPHVHEWNIDSIAQEVNCTDDEITKYVCSSCSETKTEVTRTATGHTYAEDFTSDNNTHWNECHCGAKANEEAHNWHAEYRTVKEAKCTEAGSKAIFCKDCDAKKAGSEVAIDALGHAYGTVTIDPTCSQGGFDLHICGRCGDTKKDNETSAAGHSFGQWQTIKASSCTEEGSEQRVCGECGYIESRGIVKKEHEWEADYTIDKKATCTTDGSKSIHCGDCDAVKDSTVIEATGHHYTDWEEITAPTCEAAGLSKRTCTVCEIEETLEIAKRSHDWKEEYTVDKKATCTEKGSKSIHCRDCDTIKEDSTVEVDTKPHHYGDWAITKPATFGEDGLKERACIDCEAVDTEELSIPAVVKRVVVLDPCVYDGKEQTPEIMLFDTDGRILKEGRDYEKTYTNNIDAGAGNVTVTLCGDKYKGEFTDKFYIAKASAGLEVPNRIKVRAKKTASLDAKANSTGAITYETSNKKYATVSSEGTVKGVKIGTATITVSVAGDANHNAETRTVEVIVPTVITKAALTKTSYTYDGEEHVPGIKSVNGKTSLTEGVDYIVTPPEEATDAGTYYVTVTATEDGKYDGSCKVKYTIKKASQTISDEIPKLYVNGAEENLNAKAPGTGQITYKSSSSKILTVDSEGNLTGVKAGTAYITMTAPADTNYNKATKKVKVTVYKKDNDLTTEIEPSVTLTVGETIDIGAKATGGTITYSSNKKTYAPVSSTGTITAKKAGTVTITIKAGDGEYNTVTKKITVKVVK